MTDIEEDIKRHRQGSFFKKMKQLMKSKMRPCTTILDKSDKPMPTLGESLAGQIWRRHFDNVLNVSIEVAGEMLRDLVDNSASLSLCGGPVRRGCSSPAEAQPWEGSWQ